MRFWLVVLGMLLSSTTARAAPEDVDLGAPGSRATAVMSVRVEGVAADLYCATDDTAGQGVVVLVGEPAAPRTSLAELARHLASHGIPVVVPAQERLPPTAAARAVMAVAHGIGQVIVDLPAQAPCSKIRTCASSRGAGCTSWWIVRAGASTSGQGFEDLLEAAFDTSSVEVTTVGGARHCDLGAAAVGAAF